MSETEVKCVFADLPEGEEDLLLVDTVDNEDFWDRVVVGRFEAQKGSVVWYGSDVKYVHDDDEIDDPDSRLLPIYIAAPEQFAYGIQGTWNFDIKREQQTLKNIKGYQIKYAMTSSDTVKTPEPVEAALIKFFERLREKARDALEFECTQLGDELIVTRNIRAAYNLAKIDGDLMSVVKPLFTAQKTKDDSGKSFVDDNKSSVSYIKLLSWEDKKTKMPVCKTNIYGPGDREVPVEKYLGIYPDKIVTGNLEPLIKVEGLYWGAHGPESPYIVSTRLKVYNINFTPAAQNRNRPAQRLLKKNTAPKEMDIDSDDEFPSPVPQSEDQQPHPSTNANDFADGVGQAPISATPPDSPCQESGNESEEESSVQTPSKKKAATVAKRRKVRGRKKE